MKVNEKGESREHPQITQIRKLGKEQEGFLKN
jgi:hypothetical protein